jgi:hypothetical protein
MIYLVLQAPKIFSRALELTVAVCCTEHKAAIHPAMERFFYPSESVTGTTAIVVEEIPLGWGFAGEGHFEEPNPSTKVACRHTTKVVEENSEQRGLQRRSQRIT